MADYFIISYSEWLNWINTIQIHRINFFYSNLQNIDQFITCMYKSLRGKYYDDSAFVIVKLLPDWNTRCQKKSLESGATLHCLDLAAVDEFYPVSERGDRLIRPDADMAGVLFGGPIFEEYWKGWLSTRASERFDWKGRELARLLVGGPPDLAGVPEAIRPFLLLELPWPQSAVWSDLEGGPFNAWARAGELFDCVLGLEGSALPVSFHDEFVAISNPLKLNFDFNSPLFCHDPLNSFLTSYLGINSELYFLIALIIHYNLLFHDADEVSLTSLENDLVFLGDKFNKSAAANAAYFVGALLDDGFLSKLILDRQPERFAVLSRNRG